MDPDNWVDEAFFMRKQYAQDVYSLLRCTTRTTNNNLLNDVSEPDMISSIASRVANREWRVESKSGQIPYQAEKIKPFSLSSYLRKA